jgi:hypothetical protein
MLPVSIFGGVSRTEALDAWRKGKADKGDLRITAGAYHRCPSMQAYIDRDKYLRRGSLI